MNREKKCHVSIPKVSSLRVKEGVVEFSNSFDTLDEGRGDISVSKAKKEIYSPNSYFVTKTTNKR